MVMMLAYIIGLALLAVAFMGVTLEKAYFYLPLRELQRRAARGDEVAAKLAVAARYGGELRLLLAAVTVLAAAAGLVLFARVAPFVLGVVVVCVVLLLALFWQPRNRLAAWEARAAAAMSGPLSQAHNFMQPLLARAAAFVRPWYQPRRHSGIFEKEDLHNLLTRLLDQRDSRIPSAEVRRLQQLLQAEATKVRDVMQPRKLVRAVQADEMIKPVLVDELHRSGQRYFPVYDGEAGHIIGVLPLDAVSDVRQHGPARDHASRRVAYVHSADTLEEVLSAFYATGQPVYVVVDSKGDYRGIITLEAVLRRLLGEREHPEAVFEDRSGVAKRHVSSKTVSPAPKTVVE